MTSSPRFRLLFLFVVRRLVARFGAFAFSFDVIGFIIRVVFPLGEFYVTCKEQGLLDVAASALISDL